VFVSVEKVKPMMMKSNPLLASSYSISFLSRRYQRRFSSPQPPLSDAILSRARSFWMRMTARFGGRKVEKSEREKESKEEIVEDGERERAQKSTENKGIKSVPQNNE